MTPRGKSDTHPLPRLDSAIIAEPGMFDVPFSYALGLITAIGVESIASHPAVDQVTLRDGRLVNHWKGGGDEDCRWEVSR